MSVSHWVHSFFSQPATTLFVSYGGSYHDEGIETQDVGLVNEQALAPCRNALRHWMDRHLQTERAISDAAGVRVCQLLNGC